MNQNIHLIILLLFLSKLNLSFFKAYVNTSEKKIMLKHMLIPVKIGKMGRIKIYLFHLNLSWY